MIFQCRYVFDKRNQNENKKHKLFENRFLFTKTHFQDSLLRINRSEYFLRRMTGEHLILLKMIFFKHIRSKHEKSKKKTHVKHAEWPFCKTDPTNVFVL